MLAARDITGSLQYRPSGKLNSDGPRVQICRAALAHVRAVGGCGTSRNAQAARAGAIDASRAELSTGIWVVGARAPTCPSFFSLMCSGQF
eukprot:COSAG05_NODE_524_length_8999_cov_4.187528_3_plen_90_part_00